MLRITFRAQGSGKFIYLSYFDIQILQTISLFQEILLIASQFSCGLYWKTKLTDA